MPIDLIIFDCDGVLVDSEVISCRAHAQTLTRYGYPITEEQVLERFLGRSMLHSMLEVEAEMGRRLPDDFRSQVYSEIFRLFAISLQATPHMSETLARIAEPVCVASSGPPEKISTSLNHVGLYGRFAPHIFSGMQVRHGKPAPDLFLFAAEQMRDSHHDHLINLRDGKVIEFTSEEIEKLQAEIARKLGFKLVDHRLELYCVPLDDDKA